MTPFRVDTGEIIAKSVQVEEYRVVHISNMLSHSFDFLLCRRFGIVSQRSINRSPCCPYFLSVHGFCQSSCVQKCLPGHYKRERFDYTPVGYGPHSAWIPINTHPEYEPGLLIIDPL